MDKYFSYETQCPLSTSMTLQDGQPSNRFRDQQKAVSFISTVQPETNGYLFIRTLAQNSTDYQWIRVNIFL